MLRRKFLQLFGITAAASLPPVVAEAAQATPTTFFSIRSGRWDDPNTWHCGTVPTPGSNVILLGHDLTVCRAADVATLSNYGPSGISKEDPTNTAIDESWISLIATSRGEVLGDPLPIPGRLDTFLSVEECRRLVSQ